MKSGGASGFHGLTFHWPQRPRISFALVGLLFLSVLGHAMAFYIFQIVYPPVVTVSPPPAQVNILTPLTPENQALLKWIDAEDPAAIANPHEVIPENLHDVPYKPSFAEIRTAPKPLDEREITVAYPEARSALDIINSVQKTRKQTPEKLPAQNTELRFSGQLAGRKIVEQPPLKPDTTGFDPSNAVALQAAVFFVGVGAGGEVLYTFLQESSGNDVLDRQAGENLATVKFAPGPKGVAWGTATYFWGGDAYPSTPAKQ